MDPISKTASLEDILLGVPYAIIQQLVQSIEVEGEAALDKFALATSNELQKFIFTFDSASEVHILTLEAALQLFTAQQVSNLRIIGVSGSSNTR